MALVRPSTMLLAGVIAAPAIYHAAVTHELPGADALFRYLIAVPVAAALLAVLRKVTAGYGRQERTVRAAAERLDDERPQPQPYQPPAAPPPPHPDT